MDMTDWKKTAKRILSPPPWLTLLLVVFSTAALIAVFVKEWQEAPIAYAVYVTAFYTLCVLCMLGAKRIPGWYRSGKNLVYSNKFGNRYMTDAAYKTRVSLYRSLAINLVYVVNQSGFGAHQSLSMVLYSCRILRHSCCYALSPASLSAAQGHRQ